MKTLPKGIEVSPDVKRCPKCGEEVPQIIHIAKIVQDAEVNDLLNNIAKDLKEVNRLFKRAILISGKAILESQPVE